MQAFTNLKIAYKIAALMLMLGAVTLAVAFNGTSAIRKVDAGYSHLSDTLLPNNVELARSYQGALQMTYSGYQLTAYPGRSAEGRAAVEAEREAYTTARKRLVDMMKAEPKTAPVIEVLIKQFDELHRLTTEAMKFGLADRNDEARAGMAQADLKAAEIRKELRRFTEERSGVAKAEADALTESTNGAVTSMLVIGLLGVVLAVGFGIFVARRTIIAPLLGLEGTMRTLASGNNAIDVVGTDRRDEVGEMAKAVLVFRDAARELARTEAAKAAAEAEQKQVIDTLSHHLETLAQGDLSRGIDAEFSGSYAGLKANFNGAVESLRTLIQSVMDSARTIGAGSSEIEQASEDLARRTESAAASLEETSAAVSQINDRLRAGAEASTRTVGRADQAIVTVGTGRGTAEEAVSAMGRVADSAKGIDSVIEGLDKIAFQTRVLAMNAAVEAGRAGEAGRGFAVVADLVGQLAMRSEEEAKRAREQLTTTQNDVELAVSAVQRVDGALVAISADVSTVHELLGTMAQDNQAQAAAIQQIASAISTMDHSTQQNAAMVEEASAAARSLNAEVGVLGQRAGAFRTGAATQVVRAAPVRKPATPAPAPARAVGSAKAAPARLTKPGKASKPSEIVYQSPVKPLPPAAIPSLVRDNDDWDEF
ncbi:HAMP domain-containing protein [Sphingomonas suaedae]|uniref:HAMP domain-containing protein n=1 Tax=Sphingomonas suaedae TaxID=2599297 RepID=A0A518REA9_9SPHN|nr:methyl-accepting chemotaxis protein [Sphingomonas suaedae]QDX25761.1 HAMP domain-containing protein [Sphingomonas suaedae]